MIKMTRKPSAFELRVYQAVCLIPCGKVTTYSALGREICCGSARAVGSALAKNPFAPEVPCHRVVCADGRLGGFHGETSGPWLDKKSALLHGEGVCFIAPDRISLNASTLHQFQAPPNQ
jgi:methylated-DNA-[protein]-cysteine S-methyltransferase